MRFQLVDRIIRYESGRIITGRKQISLEAESLTPFVPKKLIYPTTLCMEALAQLGGLLISATLNFKYTAFLVMISNLRIKRNIKTGSELLMTARAKEISKSVAVIEGETIINGEPVLSAEKIVYGLMEVGDESLWPLVEFFNSIKESD